MCIRDRLYTHQVGVARILGLGEAGVGVRSVETYTFQSGSNEAEVALVGQLYTCLLYTSRCV